MSLSGPRERPLMPQLDKRASLARGAEPVALTKAQREHLPFTAFASRRQHYVTTLEAGPRWQRQTDSATAVVVNSGVTLPTPHTR
jgi:hypothetical protein